MITTSARLAAFRLKNITGIDSHDIAVINIPVARPSVHPALLLLVLPACLALPARQFAFPALLAAPLLVRPYSLPAVITDADTTAGIIAAIQAAIKSFMVKNAIIAPQEDITAVIPAAIPAAFKS